MTRGCIFTGPGRRKASRGTSVIAAAKVHGPDKTIRIETMEREADRRTRIRPPHEPESLPLRTSQQSLYSEKTFAARQASVKRGRFDIRGRAIEMRDADTEKITLRLPARYLKALDFLVQVDDFPSRSEAVRAAIRDFVYGRVELVTEKLKKMQDAERTLAEAEAFKREYMQK
ncbi:MAG: ribbon-helix-helix protein, CopG family [Methanobacteriota archaeon]|nr:MAG: ribbon-helix-helix protein, CopG family [Euryarchaeota archaeon]